MESYGTSSADVSSDSELYLNASNPLPMDRSRSLSIQGFEAVANSVAAKSLRIELTKLVNMMTDEEAKKHFKVEMDNFYILFTRYLSKSYQGAKLYAI
ncbi:hypothetical protein HMI55_003621 [Coelomomyces lativittatus]|nr:hypothetical protein HMI55_003621 [Coelomomyces lativittatus]